MISVAVEDPASPDAVVLLEELSDTLAAITGSSGKASFDVNDVRVEKARFVVARGPDGAALGCGALRPLEEGVAEVKRMYSRRSLPGVGKAMLCFLEDEARQLGYSALRLETRLVNARAVRFYAEQGYSRIPNYGRYVGRPEAACFEKQLGGTGAEMLAR